MGIIYDWLIFYINNQEALYETGNKGNYKEFLSVQI
jgi:hypothetical protein